MFGNLFFFELYIIESDNGSILCFTFDDEMAIGVSVRIGGRIVVLGIIGVIVLIEGGPSWIGSVGEGSVGGVEFIREDE